MAYLGDELSMVNVSQIITVSQVVAGASDPNYLGKIALKVRAHNSTAGGSPQLSKIFLEISFGPQFPWPLLVLGAGVLILFLDPSEEDLSVRGDLWVLGSIVKKAQDILICGIQTTIPRLTFTSWIALNLSSDQSLSTSLTNCNLSEA